MCTHPIWIKNVNRGCRRLGVNRFKDCTSYYIPVPCGHCKQCYSRRQTDLVQRILMMLPFYHPFFFTLTYKTDMLPLYTCPSGHVIRYADMRDLTLMLKRIRKDNLLGRPFKYLIVSELGSKRARPHFHGILLVAKTSGDDYNTCLSMQERFKRIFIDNWQRNVGTNLRPVYKPLCIPREYWINGKRHGTYDFQYILSNSDRSADAVSFYVTKYCLKPSKHERNLFSALRLNYPPEQFHEIWNIVKPRASWSKDFGLRHNNSVQAALSAGVELSVVNGSEFPQVFMPDSGKSFPLAPFYHTTDVLSPGAQETFFRRHCASHHSKDGYFESKPRDPVRTVQEEIDLSKVQDMIDNREEIFQDCEFVDTVPVEDLPVSSVPEDLPEEISKDFANSSEELLDNFEKDATFVSLHNLTLFKHEKTLFD